MADENENKVNSQGAGAADMDGKRDDGAPTPPPAQSNKAPPAADAEAELAPKPGDKKAPTKEDAKPDPKDEGKEDEDASEDEEEDTGNEPDWKNQYIEFDDAAGQSVVELLKEAGVKPVEANAMFAEAAESGDLSKVRWDLLEARLGKAKATLAKAGIEQHYNQVWQQNKATQDFAFKEVGGEKNWQKIAKWVQKAEKADPSKKAGFDNLRKAIDIGGETAQYAIKQFKSQYEAATGNSGLRDTGDLHRGDRRGNPVGSPLTRADSLKELHAAHARNASPAEIAAIRARRAAGRQQGI